MFKNKKEKYAKEEKEALSKKKGLFSGFKDAYKKGKADKKSAEDKEKGCVTPEC